jgi:hypothetical protein
MDVSLETFFKERIFLIDVVVGYKDILGPQKTFEFIVEYRGDVYTVTFQGSSISCSCNLDKCRHMVFVMKSLERVKSGINRSKSMDLIYQSSPKESVKYVMPTMFDKNFNPRFREYVDSSTIYVGGDSDVCHVCLEHMSGKLTMCKTCSKYFHNDCIYRWLRVGPSCKCPNCRSIWI